MARTRRSGRVGGVCLISTALTITYTAKYPTSNGDGLPRRYDIVAEGGVDIQARVELCYADVELEIAGIAASEDANLHAYLHTGGGAWGEYSEVDTVNNTITASGVDSFGVWGIGLTSDQPTALTQRSLSARGGVWVVGMVAALGALLVLRRKRK